MNPLVSLDSALPYFMAYDGPAHLGAGLSPYVRHGVEGQLNTVPSATPQADPNAMAGPWTRQRAADSNATPTWQRTSSAPGDLFRATRVGSALQPAPGVAIAAARQACSNDGSSTTAEQAVPEIDWSSQPRAYESPCARFARLARAAAQPVTVYFSGAGVDGHYDASCPLGRALTDIGHELAWANTVSTALAHSYYDDPGILQIAVERHFEDRSDFHVLALTPLIPASPFFSVQADRTRAQATLRDGEALYQLTLPRGQLLEGVDSEMLIPGHVDALAQRIA